MFLADEFFVPITIAYAYQLAINATMHFLDLHTLWQL